MCSPFAEFTIYMGVEFYSSEKNKEITYQEFMNQDSMWWVQRNDTKYSEEE